MAKHRAECTCLFPSVVRCVNGAALVEAEVPFGRVNFATPAYGGFPTANLVAIWLAGTVFRNRGGTVALK